MNQLHRALTRGLGVASLVLVGVLPARSQTASTGSLEGVVEDVAGAPLHEVVVLVRERASGFTRAATTGREGRFRVPLLPAGEYELSLERLGYRPLRVLGVRVYANRGISLAVVLEGAVPPVDSVAVVRHEEGGAGGGVSRWLSALELERLPDAQRDLKGLSRLFSVAGPGVEAEGLPARMGGVVVDGLAFAAPQHPDVEGGARAVPVFPLSALGGVALAAGEVAVEGRAGGAIGASTRRGTRDFRVRAYGTWSGEALASSSAFAPEAVPHRALQGGLLVSGPILRDTAVFVLGVEAKRLETPLPQPWVPTAADERLAEVAREGFGVDLAAYQRPRLERTESVTAFGRFDWQPSEAHALSVRGSVARLPTVGAEPAAPGAPGVVFEGNDVAAAASLTSRFGERVAQEVRLGFESGRRDYRAAALQGASAADGSPLPATTLVASGFAFGTGSALPGRFEQSTLRLNQSLHLLGERHHLQLGADLAFAAYDHAYAHGRGGAFHFGGVDEFERLEGAFAQTVGPLPVAAFSVPRYAIFLQDRWRAAPELEITAGLRYEIERLPADRVRPNEAWRDATGLSGELEGGAGKLGPRLQVSWDLRKRHGWHLEATAGVYHEAVDPAVLAEILTHDGRVQVRRGLGALDAWPGLPDESVAPTRGPRLALPGPGFVPPRTSRAHLSIVRSLGAGTSVGLAATTRRTAFLPRRRDLNLLHRPVERDQHGRPVYGRLVQLGTLLAADPGSNRRFPAFDLVSALSVDGVSTHRALTVTLEHGGGSALQLFGSYTLSRTTDDWLSGRGGGPEGQLGPFPDGLEGRDWAAGRSDFDLPHRVVLAGELRLPGRLGPRLGGVYRFRSGDPFTPGFREGVDANGDGSGRNDPAFVDDQLPGAADLIARWDCLREQVGRFAERNACRTPGVHALDLSLGIDLLRRSRYTASLSIEGLNLLESATGIYDHALYLVDGAGALARDEAAGRVTVPLVANPGFGSLRVRQSPGRVLRLQLQLGY